MCGRIVSVLFATLVAACSPANEGGPSDGGAVDTGAARDTGVSFEASADGGPNAAQACTDNAAARCNRLQSCSPTAVQIHYGDVGHCEAVLVANCLAAASAPSTGTSAASLEACAAHVSDWACNDLVFSKNPPPQCVTATGGLAAGAACAFPQQCQTGFCAIVPGAACGVCASPPKTGDSCTQLTTCGQDFVCEPAQSTCVLYASAGGSCGSAQPCSAGLTCVGATGTTPGTCQTAVATQGAACVSSGAGCDLWAGLACNTGSQQCAPVVLANDGDLCGYVNLQSTACLDGICVGIVGAMPGQCSRYGDVGAVCDLASGPFCFAPARCMTTADGGTAGVCRIPDATMCP